MLSFFPVPYPDECYYSVLCRYMVHSGISSIKEISHSLFGRMVCPSATMLLPYLSSRVPEWINAETGITEVTFIRDHTAFHYLSIGRKQHEKEVMLQQIRMGERSNYIKGYRRNIASAYLRYCPICAYEEKIKYGEMYWHRQHQLKGNLYCLEHGAKLIDSEIDLRRIKRVLIPASFALSDYYKKASRGIRQDIKPFPMELRQKQSVVQKDILWLMHHGEETGGLEGLISGYKSELAIRGLADNRYGRLEKIPKLIGKIQNYFGKAFLKNLCPEKYEFMKWESAPIGVVKYLSPLEHVLMMEYLCGSAEKFVRSLK